jgi:dynein heavy chain
LGHVREPSAVQPYLSRCFENIHSLEFSADSQYQLVTAMISAEGERVELGPNLKVRGNVEDWLSGLEQRMKKVIKDGIYYGFMEHSSKSILVSLVLMVTI